MWHSSLNMIFSNLNWFWLHFRWILWQNSNLRWWSSVERCWKHWSLYGLRLSSTFRIFLTVSLFKPISAETFLTDFLLFKQINALNSSMFVSVVMLLLRPELLLFIFLIVPRYCHILTVLQIFVTINFIPYKAWKERKVLIKDPCLFICSVIRITCLRVK